MIPSSEQHKAALDAAVLAERERIARAVDYEAEVCPCEEDAKVLRGTSRLIRANFSYDDAERLEALSALPEQTRERWEPIETAPKDGTAVDFYHQESGRWPNCYWGMPPHSCGEAGQYCDNDDWHGQQPRWVDGTFGEFIGEDGFTHWRRAPAPPAGESP
jgi:hypothetical protein